MMAVFRLAVVKRLKPPPPGRPPAGSVAVNCCRKTGTVVPVRRCHAGAYFSGRNAVAAAAATPATGGFWVSGGRQGGDHQRNPWPFQDGSSCFSTSSSSPAPDPPSKVEGRGGAAASFRPSEGPAGTAGTPRSKNAASVSSPAGTNASVSSSPFSPSSSTPSFSTPSGPSGQQHNYDRNFITAERATEDFCLRPDQLAGLRVTSRRNPEKQDELPIKVYWRKDVEARALMVWGSLDALLDELERRETQRLKQQEFKSLYELLAAPRPIARVRRFWGIAGGEPFFGRRAWTKSEKAPERDKTSPKEQKVAGGPVVVRPGPIPRRQGLLESGSGKVVAAAIAINASNLVLKLVAWAVTGSHSMFSEAVHSAADTANQMILAFGLKTSAKAADADHPYGYTNMQYVTSLISGVGIFCIGSGLAIYHGVEGLLHASQLDLSLASGGQLAVGILTLSFISESVTLALAVKSIRKSAAEANMTSTEYVLSGHDPCVNVVLLEDAAAVLGVMVAGASMGLSVHLGSHIPDALGSVVIGAMLGGVATFMITTNTHLLVGRSIPEDKIRVLNEKLEGDLIVRQVHDVKGMDMGNGIIRYKAEVDVDGRELARIYLNRRDLAAMLEEVKAVQTKEDLENFMLKHGENIVDCLGEQVDRIEKELKKEHPEVRHVDLEVL